MIDQRKRRSRDWNHTGDGSIIPSLEEIADGSGNGDEDGTFHFGDMVKLRKGTC